MRKILLVSIVFICIARPLCAREDIFLSRFDFNINRNLKDMGLSYSGNDTSHIESNTSICKTPCLGISLDRIKDKNCYRTEVEPTGLPTPDFDNGKHAIWGHEYWYSVRVFIPGQWAVDKYPEIIMQWHGYPDFELGEEWRSPPVSLIIEGDRYYLTVIADSKHLTPPNGALHRYSFFKRYDLGSIKSDLGQWETWVFNIKWSFREEGYINIWKNGKFHFSKKKISTAFNDRYGPYFKFGIYKWVWNPDDPAYVPPYGINSRTIYFDDLRIGAGDVTLKDFLPNNPTAK